ncbi:MAG: O-methyltransferase [Planctomycetota bacterium]
MSLLGFVTAILALLMAADSQPQSSSAENDKIQTVINRVEQLCREETIYMIGPEKAKRLAELVREAKPKKVVECGTAAGYSGLWIARELKALGSGKLITIEIDPERVRQAEAHFREAGLADYIEVKVGDATKLVGEIEGPIDFAFIDCNAPNYLPCIEKLAPKLSPGAVVVADNAGISAGGMKGYLEFVRSKYKSTTEWFDVDLPWAKRDAMEISVVPGKPNE